MAGVSKDEADAGRGRTIHSSIPSFETALRASSG